MLLHVGAYRGNISSNYAKGVEYHISICCWFRLLLVGSISKVNNMFELRSNEARESLTESQLSLWDQQQQQQQSVGA